MPHAPIFVGSAAAVTTPFREDGSLDLYSFDRILDFILERNTDAVVVCGTTGEASTLTDEERTALIARCIKKVNKKIPVREQEVTTPSTLWNCRKKRLTSAWMLFCS